MGMVLHGNLSLFLLMCMQKSTHTCYIAAISKNTVENRKFDLNFVTNARNELIGSL